MTAKMQEINDLAQKMLSAKCLKAHTDDNIMSSVTIRGSHDEKETWKYEIWENSRFFMFQVMPEKGKRYYNPGENVTVELLVKSHEIKKPFRKSTSTPEKVIQRIQDWIEKTK